MSSGGEGEIDGDNINVVIRVRPLSQKELKNGDDNILQFPGDGGIWVIRHVLYFLLGCCQALKLPTVDRGTERRQT